MARLEKKALTAYQLRLRKDLGLDEEVTPDQQLARLETDIRRLKVEFDIYFNGAVKTPPYDTRNRIETAFSRLGDDRSLTFAQRYKYNSLASRFAAFRDLWRRAIQSKEEGRDFITVARAKLDNMRREADEEIAARNAPANPAAPVSPAPTKLETMRREADAEIAARNAAANPTAPVSPAPTKLETMRREADAEIAARQAAANPVVPVSPTQPPPVVAPPPASRPQPPAQPVKAAPPPAKAEKKAGVAPVTVAKIADQAPRAKEPTVPPAGAMSSSVLTVAPVRQADPTAPRTPEPPASPSATNQKAIPAAGVTPVTENNNVLRPSGMSFPKILPPTDHLVVPPEPVKRPRRAGDRRTGDRRELALGRRGIDHEAELENEPAATSPEALVPAENEFTATPAPAPPESKGSTAGLSKVKIPDAEVGHFAFTDPRREPAQLKKLIAALTEAKKKCGEPTDDLLPSRFSHLLAARADSLRKTTRCERVVFSVAIVNGEVHLNAQPEE